MMLNDVLRFTVAFSLRGELGIHWCSSFWRSVQPVLTSSPEMKHTVYLALTQSTHFTHQIKVLQWSLQNILPAIELIFDLC